MQRVVIIDGHNLLHKIPGIKDRYKQNPDFAITSLVKIIKPGLKKNEKLLNVKFKFYSEDLNKRHLVNDSIQITN